MSRDDLKKLILSLLDGQITPAGLEILQRELETNEQARQLYIEFSELHSLLGQRAIEAKNVVPIDRIIRRQKRRAVKVAAFAAAAVVVLGLVVMQLFFVKERPPVLAFVTAPGTQYSLTHSGASDAPEGLVLEKGSRLQILQGTVELTFGSGVKSIVMAPADLTLHDEDKLYLNKGRAWFHVPPEAVGFNVLTKDLNIVDLGTEFGVLASPDEHDEVHVFKGKVQVTSLRLRKESATLVASESCKIDPIGRLDMIKSEPTAFLTTLPNSLPFLHWSFDREDGFQVTGTHPAAADISTTPWPGDRPPNLVPGRHGTALSLDGNEQHLSASWPGFAGSRPRTVVFWLKLPGGGDHTALSGIIGWGDAASSNGKWKILAVQDQPGGKRKLRLSLGDYWLTGTSNLADETWHHIAVTASGGLNDNGLALAEFYIDGKKEPAFYESDPSKPKATGFDTIINSPRSMPLLIGSSLHANDRERFQLQGQIDEITIFDGHMNESAIQNLYQRSK